MSNIKKEEVLELVKNFPLEPLFNKVIITLNTVKFDDGVELSHTVLSDTQYIVSKGGSVPAAIKLGDKVIIDIEKLMVTVNNNNANVEETSRQVKIDPVEVDGVQYAIIEDRVIKAIDNR
jgi:hypothetical protein